MGTASRNWSLSWPRSRISSDSTRTTRLLYTCTPRERPCWTRPRAVDRNWSFRFMRCSPASFVFLLKCRSKGIHDSLPSASRSRHERRITLETRFIDQRTTRWPQLSNCFWFIERQLLIHLAALKVTRLAAGLEYRPDVRSEGGPLCQCLGRGGGLIHGNAGFR